MKRVIGALLILCMLFAVGCNGNPLQKMSAATQYQNGYEAYENKEYTQAVEAFKESIKKDINGDFLVYSYSYIGHCLMEQGEFETAGKYYEMALSTGKEPAVCYTNLGIYYRKCGDYERAEQYYRLALEADASYTEALTSLGVLYAVTGQAEEAVPLLEQAITLSEEAPAFYDANLSYAYALMGRCDDAKARLAVAKAKGYSEENYARVLRVIEECEGAASDETKTPEEQGTTVPEVTPLPEVTSLPEVTKMPEPTEVPEPTVTAAPTEEPVLSAGKIIAIDPGHQIKGNYDKEPVGPGASELKTKVSSGTQGISTKVPEHVFNLELSLKLRDALAAAGYQVVMTRETAEVDISNAERAEIANEANADIFLRIHADGAENTSANGISVLYPSEQNPYIAALSPESKKLAQSVLDGLCEATGAKKRGIVERDDLSGTNWAKMPVIVVEAGFMTNEAEEKKLIDPEYQALLVEGIVAGVEEYFGE